MKKYYLLFIVSIVFAMDVKGEGVKTSDELKLLFDADQNDRRADGVTPIDWRKVTLRDREREKRVKELYRSGAFKTGEDYYHGAMVLQHAPEADDNLLAHALSIVAITKGDARAKVLSALTLDRYLMRMKVPQQFGTQYFAEDIEQPVKLYVTGEQVTDELRKEFDLPTLEEAKKREPLFNMSMSSAPQVRATGQ